uniref:Uncharacterized protein n=1 Tax=Oryza punctata TaxID=4537 RepID=A0A0E0LAC3_ORYPU
MANFTVHYSVGEIMSTEMGIDLSNFSQCTLYHPNSGNLTMPEYAMEPFSDEHPMATERSNPKLIMEGLVARLQTSRIRDGHVGAGFSKEGSTKQEKHVLNRAHIMWKSPNVMKTTLALICRACISNKLSKWSCRARCNNIRRVKPMKGRRTMLW